MPFVERDPETGQVVGLYAVTQPGRAEELLPDDHQDVAAFRARADSLPSQRDLAAELDALQSALIKKGAITEQEIEAVKNA